MGREEFSRLFGGIIEASIGAFFEYPLCVFVWVVNIVATIITAVVSKQDIFLIWMVVIFTEFLVIIILFLYVNLFWVPKRKKKT